MTTPSRRNSLRALVATLAVVAAVVAFIAVLYAVNGGSNKADAQSVAPASETSASTATVTETSTETSTTATTTTTTASAPADVCYAVKLDKNVGNNVLSDGISQDTEEGRQQVLAAAKQDPRVLMLFYNASPLGKVSPIAAATDVAPLKDGACYTTRGVEAYDEWSTLYKVANLAPAKLPATGYNTGVKGSAPFQIQGKIPAGTGTEVKYVDSNGKVIDKNLIRNECGNIISEKVIVVIKVIEVVNSTEVTVTRSTPTTVTRTTSTTTRTTSLAPKIPGEDPGARGNAGNGGGKNQNTGPGVLQSTTPTTLPSTSRVNPTTPTAVVTTPPRVSVTTINSGSSTPTVAPSTQSVNNGWVNPTPTSGAACNPKFQSC